jgi:hypothetical protein
MNTYAWLVVGVVAFDTLILTLIYYLLIRSSGTSVRSILIPVAVGALGFVFPAFLFFSGAFLFVHLAFIAGVLGLCLWRHKTT